MIDASEEFREAIETRTDFYQTATVTLTDGTVFKLTKSNFTVTGNCYVDGSGLSTFPIGACLEKYIKVSIMNDEDQFSKYNFYGAQIELKLCYDIDDYTTIIPLGTYTVTSPETEGSVISIVAYDNMWKLDTEYVSNDIDWSNGANITDVLDEIGGNCSVPFGFSDLEVNTRLSALYKAAYGTDYAYEWKLTTKPENCTYRQVVGYIACLLGANARISNDGDLEFVYYGNKLVPDTATAISDIARASNAEASHEDENKISLSGDGRILTVYQTNDDGDVTAKTVYTILKSWNSLNVDTDDIVITGVLSSADGSSDESEGILYGETGYVISVDNPFVNGSQDFTYMIGAALVGTKFRKFNGSHIAYPLVQFMDDVVVQDRKGNTYFTFVTDVNFNFADYTDFSNSAESYVDSSTTYSITGADNKTLVAAQKLIVAEKTEREQAIEAMNEKVEKAGGMFSSVYVQEDGSKITYEYSTYGWTPDWQTSGSGSDYSNTTVVKISSAGVAISQDGGITYTTSIDYDGNAIINKINATTGSFNLIDANHIDTSSISIGSLKDADDYATKDYASTVSVWERNLIQNSDFYAISSSSGSNYSRVVDDENGTLTLKNTALQCENDVTMYFTQFALDNIGTYGSLTFDMEFNILNKFTYGTTSPWVGVEFGVILNDGTESSLVWYGNKEMPVTSPDEWVTKTVRIESGIKSFKNVYLKIRFDDVTGTIIMRRPFLTFGERATGGWSLAPEDYLTTSSIFSKGKTTIDGGKITTNSITADQIQVSTLTIGGMKDAANYLTVEKANGAITEDIIYYLASDKASGVTPDDDGWKTDPKDQTISETKRYLWIYHKYKDISGTYSNSAACISGVYGSKGDTGAAGVTVDYTETTYNKSESGTIIPSDGWSTTVPEVDQGNYLWTRTLTVYTDGKEAATYTNAFQGISPADLTITERKVTYHASASGTDIPGDDGNWQDAPITVGSGNFLWTKTYVKYSDGKDVVSYSVAYSGENGNGVASTIVAYCVTNTSDQPEYDASSKDWKSSVPSDIQPGQYLWSYKKVVYTDKNSDETYTVSYNGTNGKNGTSITYKDSVIKYQLTETNDKPTDDPMSEESKWTDTPDVKAGQYLWIYTRTIFSDDTFSEKYEVIYQGSDGDSVKVASTYVRYICTDTNEQPTSKPESIDWSDNVPDDVGPGKYLWTYKKVTYTDGNSDETYSVAYQGTNGVKITITENYVGYQVSDSGTDIPKDWQDQKDGIPEAKGKYLWTYTRIVYNDESKVESYSVSFQGTSVSIVDGSTSVYYQASTDGQNHPAKDSTAWEPTAPILAQDEYLWTKTQYAVTDGNEVKYIISYNVTKNGNNGSDGTGIASVQPIYYCDSQGENAPDAPKEAGEIKSDDGTGHWTYLTPNYDRTNCYVWTCSWVTYVTGKTTESKATTVVLDKTLSVLAGWCTTNNKTLIDGAFIGAATIVGESIAANTINASKLAVGDSTNYCKLNDNSASDFGFTITYSTSGNQYIPKSASLARSMLLSGYYECKGGESFRITGSISTSLYGEYTSSGTTTSGYISSCIALYGYSCSKGTYTYVANSWVHAKYVTGSSSATETSFDAEVTLPTGVSYNYFAVVLFNDYTSYTKGTIKVRNIEVRKMIDNALVVSGGISADKITAGTISAGDVTVTSKFTVSGPFSLYNYSSTDTSRLLYSMIADTANTYYWYNDGTIEEWASGTAGRLHFYAPLFWLNCNPMDTTSQQKVSTEYACGIETTVAKESDVNCVFGIALYGGGEGINSAKTQCYATNLEAKIIYKDSSVTSQSYVSSTEAKIKYENGSVTTQAFAASTGAKISYTSSSVTSQMYVTSTEAAMQYKTSSYQSLLQADASTGTLVKFSTSNDSAYSQALFTTKYCQIESTGAFNVSTASFKIASQVSTNDEGCVTTDGSKGLRIWYGVHKYNSSTSEYEYGQCSTIQLWYNRIEFHNTGGTSSYSGTTTIWGAGITTDYIWNSSKAGGKLDVKTVNDVKYLIVT